MTTAPNATLFSRESGVILHPTSLPGPFGIGDFGPAAHQWLDKLAEASQAIWQVLPMGPTGYGDSPYQALSAFATNPALLSPEALVGLGLLRDEDLFSAHHHENGAVDYSAIYPTKEALSRKAAERFDNLPPQAPLRTSFAEFCARNADWLEDYVLYAAIKADQQLRPWTQWPEPLRDREPDAIAAVAERLQPDMARRRLEQFLLDHQWQAIRSHAARHGIRIIGDLPIFVAHDSADVWVNRRLFQLNDDGSPKVVAGVPPDYFSATGQLWGNPLYDWAVHAESGYDWWQQRLRKMLEWVDVVRIDHFRGFAAYWEIPGGAPTAIDGKWVTGPGKAFFEVVEQALGRPMPIIAEDLGVITPDVVELRDAFELPGIRILQFGFGDDPMKGTFLPEGFAPNCVAYTGTHDNDTVRGWFQSQPGQDSTRSADVIAAERDAALTYFGTDGSDIHWDFINALLASCAGAVIVPVQDTLGLGSEGRMNTPGKLDGNWRWRLSSFDALEAPFQRLGELSRKHTRSPAAPITPLRAAN